MGLGWKGGGTDNAAVKTGLGGAQPDLDQRTEPKSNPNLVQIKYHTARGAFEVLSLKMHQMWNGGYGAGLSHCMWG